MNEEAHSQLQALRAEIDIIDNQLVELLNQRAAISIKIGHVKKLLPSYALDIKDHEREKDILSRIRQYNIGPLNDKQLTELFEHVMSQSSDLQSTLS